MKIIKSTEEMADQIYMNKQELIALNKRRQQNREKWKKTFINEELQTEGEIQILQSDQKIMVNKHRNLEHFSPFSDTNIKLNSWKAKKLMQ
uniref:Uncharacterized protein n=1 Tax=Glossina morsitans morsitans TaxID=37546 RepID=A0A1B0FCY7_GLOMM